jgi:hypothetical protein
MGIMRGANGFWWKNLEDRDHLEAPRLHGCITLKWIFRLIHGTYHSHDSRTTKWKKLTTEEPNGL